MSSSVRKCRGGARRSAPVGCCGSRAGLLPLVQGSVETVEGVWTEVQIRWKPILDQLVAALGGSSPMYTTEETHDIMFQQRVTFTIPLDRSGMEWDNVSVTGVKCLSECEAQTEAAATALQRFACGIYNTKVMDISQCQYEKLRMSCQNTVVKAREQHLALDMILSSWLNCTQQIDRTYRSLFPIPSQYVYGESDNIIIKLKTKLSKQLQTLVTLNYERHNTLLSRAEARKKYQENVCVSTQRYFDEYVIPRDERRQGESAREVKISMQITLFEMMISLGWDEPEYSPLWRVGNVYAYSVELQPSGDDSERILIEGADEASEEKAMESVAKQAILQLEEVLAIYLVDLNYNKRSYAENNVAEAMNTLNNISFIATEALDAWEEESEQLNIVDDYCRGIIEAHEIEDLSNGEYNIKWECTEAIAELYKACSFNLQLARRRHDYFSNWMDK